MNRRERKLAHRASESEKRAARVFSEGLPPSAGYFDGRTPSEIDGVPTFRGKGAGGCGRMRYGRVERKRGGGLKLAPLGRDPGAPKHGGAKLDAGTWLVVASDDETGAIGHYVATEASGRLSSRAGDMVGMGEHTIGDAETTIIDRVK